MNISGDFGSIWDLELISYVLSILCTVIYIGTLLVESRVVESRQSKSRRAASSQVRSGLNRVAGRVQGLV